MPDDRCQFPGDKLITMQFPQLLNNLSQATSALDQQQHWPREQLAWMAEANVLRLGLPAEFGGVECIPGEFLEHYVDLAAACLTTTFVLTQRNGACQRLAACENDELKQRLLPDLIAGRTFATVGISHLTTSRQHLDRPAVEVQERSSGYVLDGIIPWVTGAAHADHIVAGGTLNDGRQVLMAIPRGTSGVSIEPHAKLLALTGSHTASVALHRVTISADSLVAGPVARVMQQGSAGGTGSLTTSALALGLAKRCLMILKTEAERRNELWKTLDSFQNEFEAVHRLLFTTAAETSACPPNAAPAISIRQQANSLVMRLSQTVMAVSKGAGFVRGHPAEQAVREAMFFLVWSCPHPVLQATLAELACHEQSVD